jgi:nucleotide-binding universal stress UspA family protein
MKILLATDGSNESKAAIDELTRRPWPPGSQVCVISAAYAYPAMLDSFPLGNPAQVQLLELESQRAAADAASAAHRIRERRPDLEVFEKTALGSPSAVIVDEAESWGADLIFVGSHGRSAASRFLLGSVSNAVALHAPCSVEIVRHRPAAGAAAVSPPSATAA